jgi:hypothetical protein
MAILKEAAAIVKQRAARGCESGKRAEKTTARQPVWHGLWHFAEGARGDLTSIRY